MEYLNKRYEETLNKLENAGQQLEQMKGDLWLTAEDKANRRQHIANDLMKEVTAATDEIYNQAFDNLAEAHNDFYDSLKGNAIDRKERAAIIGAAYAAMSNDELLRVLDEKFDNTTERGLLLDYLEARAAGRKKETAAPGFETVEDPLKQHITDTINKNIKRLSGYAANCFARYQEAQDGETFARNAETALRTELLKHKGELQGPNLILRRDALNNIAALKQKYNTTAQTTQQSGALPYSGPRAKRGTQRLS